MNKDKHVALLGIVWITSSTGGGIYGVVERKNGAKKRGKEVRTEIVFLA